MVERVKNLDTGKETVLLSIWDIASRIGADTRILERWIRDEEIETPTATYEFSGRKHWTNDSVEQWKALWENHISEGLEKSFTKRELFDLVIREAKATARQANSSYKHGRGTYSLAGARKAVVELEALWDFVIRLGGREIAPTKEIQDEYYEQLAKAKAGANMQP